MLNVVRIKFLSVHEFVDALYRNTRLVLNMWWEVVVGAKVIRDFNIYMRECKIKDELSCLKDDNNELRDCCYDIDET